MGTKDLTCAAITECDYSYKTIWNNHLLEEMAQQRKMSAYISECLILSEGSAILKNITVPLLNQ